MLLLNPLKLLVPEVGIEPTRAQGPLDFESSASTSFTTPALVRDNIGDTNKKNNRDEEMD